MIRLYTLPALASKDSIIDVLQLPPLTPLAHRAELWVVSPLCCGTLHPSSGPVALCDAGGGAGGGCGGGVGGGTAAGGGGATAMAGTAATAGAATAGVAATAGAVAVSASRCASDRLRHVSAQVTIIRKSSGLGWGGVTTYLPSVRLTAGHRPLTYLPQTPCCYVRYHPTPVCPKCGSVR